MLRQNGLALGGSLENAIVLGETGVLNNALRFEDEFVRHKILDAIGDLALVGYPVIGHLVAHRAGHALHTEFAAKILEETHAWRLVEAPLERGRAAGRLGGQARRAAARELDFTYVGDVLQGVPSGRSERPCPTETPTAFRPSSGVIRYLTHRLRVVVCEPQRSNQSIPSLTRSNFSA